MHRLLNHRCARRAARAFLRQLVCTLNLGAPDMDTAVPVPFQSMPFQSIKHPRACWLVCWPRTGPVPCAPFLPSLPAPGQGPPRVYYLAARGGWHGDPARAVTFGSACEAEEARQQLRRPETCAVIRWTRPRRPHNDKGAPLTTTGGDRLPTRQEH